jgi:DNA-binding NarL/FixJ family response regulator
MIHLSPRQRQVATLVAEGFPIKSISTLLRISQKTVEYHYDMVRQRIGCDGGKNPAVLVARFALANGLSTLQHHDRHD